MSSEKPLWIIHNHRMAEDPQRLLDYLKLHNKRYFEVAWEIYQVREAVNHLKCHEPVILRGTIWSHSEAAQCRNGWNLNLVDFKQLEFTNYCWWIGQDLLNHDYLICPFGDLARRLNDSHPYYCHWGMDESFFVKPNSSKKSFGGQVLKPNDFISFDERITQEKLVKHLGFNDLSALVVVSRARTDIKTEYRLIMLDDKPLCGSTYLVGGEIVEKPISPADNETLFAFARQVARRAPTNSFPRLYTMDIAETNHSYEVIELNGFGTAGLYGCDPGLYVDPIEAFAEEDFEIQRGSKPNNGGPSFDLTNWI